MQLALDIGFDVVAPTRETVEETGQRRCDDGAAGDVPVHEDLLGASSEKAAWLLPTSSVASQASLVIAAVSITRTVGVPLV